MGKEWADFLGWFEWGRLSCFALVPDSPASRGVKVIGEWGRSNAVKELKSRGCSEGVIEEGGKGSKVDDGERMGRRKGQCEVARGRGEGSSVDGEEGQGYGTELSWDDGGKKRRREG